MESARRRTLTAPRRLNWKRGTRSPGSIRKPGGPASRLGRPLHDYTLSNEVDYIPPKARVYRNRQYGRSPASLK
jgi:hypothetical protein